MGHQILCAPGSSLPYRCPNCGMFQLCLVPTVDGAFDAENCAIVCALGCRVEFPLEQIQANHPDIVNWFPDGRDFGPEKYSRGREDGIVFGKGFGARGRARSEQLRYAIDVANGWGWNPKQLHGTVERDALYGMKATVGVFETKPMQSSLEMLSRRIERFERRRHSKVPEPMVDRIAKLVRKGIGSAEMRRPTTSRERRLIVETIMQRMGLSP